MSGNVARRPHRCIKLYDGLAAARQGDSAFFGHVGRGHGKRRRRYRDAGRGGDDDRLAHAVEQGRVGELVGPLALVYDLNRPESFFRRQQAFVRNSRQHAHQAEPLGANLRFRGALMESDHAAEHGQDRQQGGGDHYQTHALARPASSAGGGRLAHRALLGPDRRDMVARVTTFRVLDSQTVIPIFTTPKPIESV